MSIEAYPSPNGVLTSLIWRKTMSGGETSLSGYDNASQALSYTPGQEQVYLNGILLVRGDDYTATNGTSITGLSALAASDFVQVNCYNNFSVASVPAASLTGTVTNAQLANSAITINGSAISLGGTVTLAGDIESVTATSPLTGGGSTGALTVGIQEASTSQRGSVQLSDSTSTTSSVLAATPTAVKSAYDLANGAIPKTLTTTTGDIIYASSANTPARLGIGSTGQVLGISGGVPAWATPASGGMTLISSTALTGSSVSFTSITGAYKNLYIHLSNPYASSAGGYRMTFNNDTTSTNYNFFYSEPDNATMYPSHTNFWSFQQGNWGFCSGGAGAASNGNAFHLWVYDYAGGTKKVYNGVGWALHSNGNSQMFPTATGVYRSNTAITRLDLIPNSGTWSGGTAYLYGVN